MSTKTLLVLNGPGLADPQEFAEYESGVTSLDQIRYACAAECAKLQVALDFRQSDDQDQIVHWIADDTGKCDALIFNQMGCADRTSIDYARYCSDLAVLSTLPCPVIEIHMTNVFRFDPGKFKALQGPEGKTALICGLGLDSYLLAIRAAASTVAGERS